MASIFSKIINGEVPAYKVAENTEFLAFLDINPNAKGHTLCIPKQEVDKIFDLDKEMYRRLMSFSYDVAQAIKKAIPCKRVGMSVIGLEVPHTHVHLVPLQEMADITFQKKTKLTTEEFEKVTNDIQKAYQSLG